ncbi:MAG: hypothetical protein ABI851_10305 [Saprospiraceae bacterium]
MREVIINPVLIKYFLKSMNTWQEIELEFDKFFEIEEGYLTVFDLIEKNFMEPRLVINFEFKNILFLNILCSDNLGNKKITNFTYWYNGLCQLKDSMEYSNGILTYRTIITSSCNVNDINNLIIVRYDLLDGQLYPTMHVECRNEDYESSVSINVAEFEVLSKQFKKNSI